MKSPSALAKTFTLAAVVVGMLLPPAIRADIVNVARNGIASSNQPIYGGWSMDRLIDGNVNSQLHADANLVPGLAYAVDLGKAYPVNQLKIWPRQDGCCPDRLTNFRISVHVDDGAGGVGAEVWGTSLYTDGTNPGAVAGTVVTVDPPSAQTGRWIQILSLADVVPDYALQIFELEVFATVPPEEVNRALNVPATSNNPLYADALPSLLVDGSRSTLIHGTDVPSVGMAYDINLGAPINLSSLVIWARQDGCCPERLTNYRVSVHQNDNGAPGTQVWKADLHTDGSDAGSGPGSKDELTAALDPAGTFTGQWIRILSLEDPVQPYALQIAEVEAYGASAGVVVLSVAAEPQDATVGIGTPATFNVTALAAGGNTSLITYQWQKEGVEIPGANAASYTTPPLAASDDGKKFRCVVGYPGLPSQTSTEATVRMNLAFQATVSANALLWGGGSANGITDGNRTTIVHGVAGLPLAFAYEANLGVEVNISQIVLWARQDGCCPERLTNYRLSVHKDAAGQIGDQVWAADLHSDGSNPGATAGSKDEAVASLDPTGTFKGQWIRILSLEDPVQDYALQIGELEVYGAYASQTAVISFVSVPADAATAPGRSVRFSAAGKVVNGNAAQLGYQWQRNGSNIPGATDPVYNTPPLAAADANTTFRCILSYPGVPDLPSPAATVTFNYNFARGQPVSSNQALWNGSPAALLVNGNRNDTTHGLTGIAPGFAYDVDLGADITVSRIDIYPRQDGCCPERLTNFRVSLHSDNAGVLGAEVWHADLFTDGSYPEATVGTVVAITQNMGVGTFNGAHWFRILSLDDPVGDYALQINEIEVYAAPPAVAPAPAFTNVAYDPATHTIQLTWSSQVGAIYTLEGSTTLGTATWVEVNDNVTSGGASTTYSYDVNLFPPGGSTRNELFLKVSKNP